MKCQISDPQADSVPASFRIGVLTIAAAIFEGDVSPRPGGDKALTVTDWVLEGRFAARLDSPTTTNEFQRADCAPRETLGDGFITVADWVQAGRYATALDPVTAVGGPVSEPGQGPLALLSPIAHNDSPRQLKVANASFCQGQLGTLAVYLESQGNENALGFSMSFDPSALSYVSASLGADAKGATLVANATQAAAGQIAYVLALPPGTSFADGTRQVLQLSFRAAAAASGTYVFALRDKPVTREVDAVNAAALSSLYFDGTAVVNPLPTLRIERSAQSVTLTWPQWATNFVLQSSSDCSASTNWTTVPDSVGTSNGENAVTLPLNESVKFYRLLQK
jgi:hypothetical protein